MNITEKRWTRLTPWLVVVSPLDDPDMPAILMFYSARDAELAVVKHNLEICR